MLREAGAQSHHHLMDPPAILLYGPKHGNCQPTEVGRSTSWLSYKYFCSSPWSDWIGPASSRMIQSYLAEAPKLIEGTQKQNMLHAFIALAAEAHANLAELHII